MVKRAFESTYKALGDFAHGYLLELRRPFGFAASEARTGLYNTLFGRDSLWTLIFLFEACRLDLESVSFAWIEEAAKDTLNSLCLLQGERENDVIEEQPGKIIHEFREEVDERTRYSGLAFENGRSYSGFDQTFLFITAYRRFCDLFPASTFVEKGWPYVRRAIEWIERYADEDNDGLFEYRRRHSANLLNQVWKDSFDSVVRTGFDLPVHPLAWIEVQAYAFRALLDAADLCSSHHDTKQAYQLSTKASVLQNRVNAQFWLPEECCFAIALDGQKVPIPLVSSNAGHTLWSGIVEQRYERSLVDRLMRTDMFTHYGLRTLSSESPFYAPFTYHRGNVWPFDNGVFAMGLFGQGYSKEAHAVIEGVSEAISLIGTPIELYVVLEPAVFVTEPHRNQEILALRRPKPLNRNQAWTASALLYFAAAIAKMNAGSS
jgi:glycogen debranching enzyme